MKRNVLRTTALAIGLLASFAFTNAAKSKALDVDAATAGAHRSGLTAKITLRDGSTRIVKLEGVGCPQAICSRTAIHAQAGKGSEVRAWFDSLASIQDATTRDALFVSKDGTRQRLSLLYDFRVLYLTSQLGGSEKLDLSKVRSVEFAASLP